MRKRRGVLVLVGVLVLLVLVGLLVRALVVRAERTPLERALRMVPADALRVGFTDWAAARRIAGVPASTRAARIQRLVDRAYDRDLSATSGIDDSGAAMQRWVGFSPGSTDWEVLSQSRVGMAEIIRLDDDVDPDDVRRALQRSGFERPSSDTGVWRGGADLLAGLDPSLPPTLQNLVVLGDRHVVVASNSASYAVRAARAVTGDARSLADEDDTDALTHPVTQPVVAAMLWSRDFSCEDLAMSKGGSDAATAGDRLVAAAGGVHPVTGLLMARPAGRSLTVVERYESAEEARRDLRPRARLAVGDAPGRGGSFTDDFRLTGSRTDGADIVLTLRATPDQEFLLSSLDNGPVLFASC